MLCRYDVLLTTRAANATGAASAFWISTQVQFRPGSPSGYAVLAYGNSTGQLPLTPPPQPGSKAPWTLEQVRRGRA